MFVFNFFFQICNFLRFLVLHYFVFCRSATFFWICCFFLLKKMNVFNFLIYQFFNFLIYHFLYFVDLQLCFLFKKMNVFNLFFVVVCGSAIFFLFKKDGGF
ncbi:hypothetical protein HanRHA438_Chr08g0342311 [Helianthus annuus]|nr:hypothetical protein HanRHA438_Chr08g0342311 [Helianthus annuus]